MRLSSAAGRGVVAALGVAQTVGWASSYYLPAVLATPMASELGVSPTMVFAGFSMAMVVSAFVGPWAGRRIDGRGGRGVLMASNVVFALGLVGLGLAPGPAGMLIAWLLVGLGMGMGLYEAAFATLAGVYGREARSPITGVTLIAGFASTVGWPLTGLIEAGFGWRVACFGWAAIHLLIALPLNWMLPDAAGREDAAGSNTTKPEAPELEPSHASQRRTAQYLLAFVFAATWFCSTAMAAHLPRLLEAAGATTAVAIAAGALIGPAQVAARIAEFGLLRRFHPLLSARLAAAGHPLGAAALIVVGGPAAYAFALLHGAGNGVLTIVKGTLPLAIFGPRGYGELTGWLNAPARALQAAAPLAFGFALEGFGVHAVWLTAGLSLLALAALLRLRATR